MTEFLDLKQARRPGQEQKRVNVDSRSNPSTKKLTTRQSLLKLWQAEC